MGIEKQVEKLTKAVEGLTDQWEEIGSRTTANAVQVGFVRDDLQSLRASLSSFTLCFMAAVPTLLRVISEKVDKDNQDVLFLIDLFKRCDFDWRKFVEDYQSGKITKKEQDEELINTLNNVFERVKECVYED